MVKPLARAAGRFARHVEIQGWDQDLLASSVVVVVGAGALGNEVLRLLAMTGIGRLVICDHDSIEESNLSRTVLFRDGDVGKNKAVVAAGRLEELSPTLRCQPRTRPFINGVGLAELSDADLVIACVDSRTTRIQISGRCNLVGAPLIDGGTHPWGGEVRFLVDSAGPCYGCLHSPSERAHEDAPLGCLAHGAGADNAEGSSALASGLIASWMALGAVRFLLAMSVPNNIITVDGAFGHARVVAHPRDPSCPLHLPLEGIVPIALSPQSRIDQVKAAMGPHESVVLWEPTAHERLCARCGQSRSSWEPPVPQNCALCGDALLERTTLELDDLPNQLTLDQAGVPPREVLTVRSSDGSHRFVELAGQMAVRAPAR